MRESKQRWLELLRDLKEPLLKLAPNLAVGDGALALWAALVAIFPRRVATGRMPERALVRVA